MDKYTIGQKVKFCDKEWEIAKIEPTPDHWEDKECTHRLALIQRNETGKIVNAATGIRNTDLDEDI